MASRKEQKEQARAQRLAAEQAAAARGQRTRRLQMLAGVVIIAAVVVAVAIAVSSGGGTKTVKAGSKQAKVVDKTVANELQGIPEHLNVLGNPNAKVTMTYFGDLKCPVCMAFTTGENLGGVAGGLPQFVSGPVRAGKAKVQYLPFCTATCSDGFSSEFVPQQVAALAAGLQGKFWYFAEIFYREQQSETLGYSTPAYLKSIAEQVPGLNMSKWQTDLKDPNLVDQVQAGEQQASKDGVTGTPTLIMTGPKGSDPVGSGVATYSQLVQAMNTVT